MHKLNRAKKLGIGNADVISRDARTREQVRRVVFIVLMETVARHASKLGFGSLRAQSGTRLKQPDPFQTRKWDLST